MGIIDLPLHIFGFQESNPPCVFLDTAKGTISMQTEGQKNEDKETGKRIANKTGCRNEDRKQGHADRKQQGFERS